MSIVVLNLILTSLCSDEPAVQRRWRVRNLNPFNVPYTFDVIGTGQTGSQIAPPGDSIFFTDTVPGPNVTRITWLDGEGKQRSTVKASGGVQCPPGFGKLAISKFIIAGPGEVVAGEVNTWTIRIIVSNPGKGAVTNTVMSDLGFLDNVTGVTILGVTKGSASVVGDDILWDIGTLDPSEVVVLEAELSGSFDSPGERKLDEASVTGNIPPGHISAGPVSDFEILVQSAPPVPSISLSKTVDGPAAIASGQNGAWTYILEVENSGNVSLEDVTVMDHVLLDLLLSLHNTAVSAGAVTVSNGSVTWDVGKLEPGQTETAAFAVEGAFKAFGKNFLNRAVASGLEPGEPVTVVSDTATGAPIEVSGQFHIVKFINRGHVEVETGAVDTWRVEIRVLGAGNGPIGNVVVTDTIFLDTVEQVEIVSVSKGTAAVVGSQITWNAGTLLDPEVIVLIAKLTGSFDVAGSRLLDEAYVIGELNGGEISAGPARDFEILVRDEPVIPALSLIKKILRGPQSLKTGEKARWVVALKVTNLSGSVLEDVIVSDLILLDRVDRIKIKYVSRGEAAVYHNAITWEVGTLAPGSSALAVFSVTGSFNAAGKRKINQALAAAVDSETQEFVFSKVKAGRYVSVKG